MSVKEQVLQAIQRLPDDIDGHAVANELALLAGNYSSTPSLPAPSGALRSGQPRPFGLCAGEFVTPADFDDPLPSEVLRDFEGA